MLPTVIMIPSLATDGESARTVRRLVFEERPRQDSNLRSRLRRAVLYPLSYGGRIWAEEDCTRRSVEANHVFSCPTPLALARRRCGRGAGSGLRHAGPPSRLRPPARPAQVAFSTQAAFSACSSSLAQLAGVTHIHVAGEIHVDPAARAPHWLSVPTDVNELLPELWSANTGKDADGVLRIAGLDVDQIAREVGTPAYVLDAADLKARARTFAEAFAGWQVYYAAKSFLCTAVARWVAAEGLGVDVCSGGELAVALRAGVDPGMIGLHGNNKSEEELRTGLAAGVGRIIVDSFDEIARLNRLARYLEARPRVMVRVTTGVEAHTHEFIATAHEDQKFGFSIAGGQAAD